jgi:hypothetical protein
MRHRIVYLLHGHLERVAGGVERACGGLRFHI